MTTPATQWLLDVETGIDNAFAVIKADITITEAKIQEWVAKIQAGLGILETDLAAGLKWVAAQAPGWVLALQAASALAAAIPGLQIPASVGTVIADAAAGLTAVAASVKAGQASGATLVTAYKAIVNAQAAHASILQVVTSAPTPSTPPSAPTS
jgi:hypothetical protein